MKYPTITLLATLFAISAHADPPSQWGAGDEAGASNHITPAKVLDAVSLITSGRIFELGRPYEQGMPLFGTRVYKLTIPGSPTGGPFGTNNLIFHDEMVSSEIGQVGTQFDGLGHIGELKGGNPDNKGQMVYYNGFTETEIVSADGLVKLGVEKIKPLFTSGVLIDVASILGDMDAGEEITLANVHAALSAQGMSVNDIHEGDAVLFRTNWGRHWIVDNATFNNGAPGIGLEVAEWLVDKNVALVGADTWPVEVVPSTVEGLVFPVHQMLLRENGIFLHENLDLEELSSAAVYRFAYVFVRVPLKGATGSAGSPIAIR